MSYLPRKSALPMSTPPLILMTSLPESAYAHGGMFNAVLRKPFTPEALQRAIDACFDDGATRHVGIDE